MENAFSAAAPHASQSQSAFACNLLALTPEQRQLHAEVTERLGREVLAVTELPDGFAFQVAPQAETLQLLADFVIRERLCCPFFAFSIRVEPDAGPLWLHLTGAEGIKPFIRAELEWFEIATQTSPGPTK